MRFGNSLPDSKPKPSMDTSRSRNEVRPSVRAIEEALRRCSLGFFPTPLVEMKRLSRHLGGPRLWIKRDDLSGLALGGNKTRKLEFLMGQALAQGCDAVITAGAAQSNHCRQTAAGAAMLGLSCHLALGGAPPPVANGNLLLDDLFGATIHWSGGLRKGEGLVRIESELRSRGLRPFVIPYGGSNPVGAAGFAAAAIELNEQLPAAGARADAIVFASSSGGTHAGLLAGASMAESSARIIGIEIDKRDADEDPFDAFIARLARQTAELLGVEARYSPSDVVLKSDYLGAGYGVVGELEREAIRLMAEREGILLDPVYTGRAFGALVDLISRREFRSDEHVIFWHTGGSPALFSYAEALTWSRGGTSAQSHVGRSTNVN
jgi:D-cysteine desulfhydrase family pyridoxal phosphate-dependent enzyme